MKEERDIKGKNEKYNKKIQFLKNIWRLWSLQKAFETFLTEDSLDGRKKERRKNFISDTHANVRRLSTPSIRLFRSSLLRKQVEEK